MIITLPRPIIFHIQRTRTIPPALRQGPKKTIHIIFKNIRSMPLEQTRLNFKPVGSSSRRPSNSSSQRGGRGGGSNGRKRYQMERKDRLRNVAVETIAVLPTILSQLPTFDAAQSSIHDLLSTPPLDPAACPGFSTDGQPGTRIRVLDSDTFDAALDLQPNTTVSTTTEPTATLKPVAVLNLASATHPGGGWKNGALAQEEALCYRSSLYLSLHDTYYPIPTLSALYTPNVLLIRTAMSAGHTLLDASNPACTLPVTSVISVAGLQHPAAKDGRFAIEGERNTTKKKIRVSLRIAAHYGHTKLVLGALGCGVFANPPEDVARCFLEVLREDEFSGGWWEEVVFAVLDNARGEERGVDGSGNLGVFYRELHGEVV